MSDPRSICLLRLSAIGDCCHALAVVRTLQKHLPKTALTWVIGRTEASLMSGLDGVELLVYDKTEGRGGRKALSTALGDREFDVLLNMHASWRANLVSRVIRAKRRIGFDRSRARDSQWLFSDERIASQHRPHVIDGMFGFAEKVGVMHREYDWRLPIDDTDYTFADQYSDKPLLVISPCSSERARNFRNWPVDRFVACATAVSNRYGARVVVTGGGTDLEKSYAERIVAEVPDAVDLVGQSSLKQLAALISRSTAVLCPDSGPAHIGTAVGTPVVGLFATSNPGRTGPSRDQQWIVDAYPQACEKFLSKSVDDVRWGQRVRHPEAMSLISTEAVLEKLNALFGQ
ncbi:MAG: glycosyltransferase family 9 protein [Pseudomonadota bacterium]